LDGKRRHLRVGTRGSLLARTQTEQVIALLQSAHPDLGLEMKIIQTTGDIRRDVPYAEVGAKGMFVKEIEEALLSRTIDLGVHSLKDMPSLLPDGLVLACVPQRADPFDALLSRAGTRLTELPQAAVVGTSSMRRQALLRRFRPDLRCVELRGNLDTRLRKLSDGDFDAIVVACAGLARLGLADRITERLSPEVSVPAVGQGALALEARAEDVETLGLLSAIHDADTADCVGAERAFLNTLGGGCSVPAGAFATVNAETISLLGVIVAPDGSRAVQHSRTGSRQEAATVGAALATWLLEEGGAALMKG
jgi:hydroxymethylbilane synthase